MIAFAEKIFRKKNAEEISCFENIKLSISGMRGTREYEIVCHGEKSDIFLFALFYINGNKERRLEKNTERKTDEIIKILNLCCFAAWNGFIGKHPKNVSDGEMFSLDAVINGSEKIHAEGSANFPKGYREFIKNINEMIQNGN